MAAPNIVNVATITGKTVGLAVTTSATAIVANSAASGKVFKVNALYVSNIDGTNNADITLTFYNADNTTSYHVAKTVVGSRRWFNRCSEQRRFISKKGMSYVLRQMLIMTLKRWLRMRKLANG
jgi:hypothetical protein